MLLYVNRGIGEWSRVERCPYSAAGAPRARTRVSPSVSPRVAPYIAPRVSSCVTPCVTPRVTPCAGASAGTCEYTHTTYYTSIISFSKSNYSSAAQRMRF